MSFEIFLRETDVRSASLNTLLYSAACWSSHEVPCRFIQTNYVYKKALTSLWYNLSQGKLHSLVTLLQQLWSSDTGSTSSAFLDSEDWIGLPEGSQMFSSFSFSFLCLIVFVLIYLAADSWHLHLFMLIHNILIVRIRHLFVWLTVPTSKGVINQDKAVLSLWQLWQNGEVDRADWVCQFKVMTVIWNAWKEPVTCATWLITQQVMAICCLVWNALAWSTMVINAEYLSCEVVKRKHVKLYISVWRVSCCCCCSFLFHYVAINESQ